MKNLQVLPALLISLLLALSLSVSAEQYVAGTHYDVIEQPVRPKDPGKIEVVEVFWYGCGACFKFEPMVQQWKKQQANDVSFVHSPIIWNRTTATHAKMYYTAKFLKALDRVHQPIFDAMNLQNKKLASPKEIEELFVGQGVDGEKFKKMFNSFGVNSQVKQAEARALGYKVTGTPTVVINGKYRVSVKKAGGYEGMLKVMDFLVNKERTTNESVVKPAA